MASYTIRSVVTLWLMLLVNAVLGADIAFKLGKPPLFGSGCPTPKSVEVVASKDAQVVSLLFSEFAATTTARSTRERKTCSLVLPISAMPGKSVGIFQVDYRGYAFVPPSDKASFVNFQTEYFLAGSRGPTVNQTWPAGSDTAIYLSNKLQLGAVVFSPCGATTMLRVSTAVTAAKSTLKAEDPQIVIDTTDMTLSNGVYFYMATKQRTTKKI